MGAQGMALAGPSSQFLLGKRNRNFHLPHETKHSSDALKDPRIRRAVSTLVYATPLHPAQGHLPMTMHPPNSTVKGGRWAGRCVPAAAMLEQNEPSR